MTQATRPSPSPLVESDRIEGTAVYTVDGKQIGTIKRLIIEKVSGKVVYVVLSFGVLLDASPRTCTVPWGKLAYDVELGGFRTDIAESQLRDTPTFVRPGEDTPLSEAQEEELHAHFNIPPYWRAI